MHRRLSAPIAVCALLVSSLSTGAAAATPELEDKMTAWGILVPGESGVGFTPHEEDQRLDYAAFVDDDQITADELGNYFHPLQWGVPPDEIEEEYQPPGRTDVTIYRDSVGVPNIYGDTDEALMYGIGYAQAEDRMWQIDIVRHLSTGRLSELIGDSYLEIDEFIRRNLYTTDELQDMYDALDDRFGEVGAQTQSLLEAFTDGINAYVQEANESGMPVEYYNQGEQLLPWSVLDTVAIAVYQGRDLGGNGGNEVQRAAFLKHLRSRLGKATGDAVFNDILFANDPDSYPSIQPEDGTFESPTFSDEYDPKAVAIPDNVKALATQLERESRLDARIRRQFGLPKMASNGIVVAGDATVNDDPIQFGAPQLGYNAPASLWEVEAHSPSFDYAGANIPGSPWMGLGRTGQHAWMVPVGVGDMMDERAERLCNPASDNPLKNVKKNSKFYMFNNRCKKMKSRTELIYTDDPSEDPFRVKYYRTVHGPVVSRGTVKKKPIAISQQRATWGYEPDVLTTLMYWSLKSTDTIEEFQVGVSDYFPFSFNLLYADEDVVAYWYSGRHMIRADGVNPRLPSWGTGKWEWQGVISEEQRPHVVDPTQGWLVNWNSKPSTGWDNSASGGWGSVQRVLALKEGMEMQGGPFTPADVAQVEQEAATRDINAMALWEHLSGSISPADTAGAEVKDAIQGWVDMGSHRTDIDRDENQDSATAVAAWDTMLEDLVLRVFTDEIGDLESWGIELTDDAASSNGSSYFYSWVNYLWNLASGNAGKYSLDYCDNIDTDVTETCAQMIQESFDYTMATLTSELGADPATWEWPADYLEFNSLGSPSVAPIPWQNRGTWNHLVEIHD